MRQDFGLGSLQASEKLRNYILERQIMKVVFFILAILLVSHSFAKTNAIDVLTKDESNLKDFGFTYCLAKTEDESLKSEASLAMGGYFQLGNQTEEAYSNLKTYINNYLAGEVSVYQSTGKPADLMQCLKLYNSENYINEVRKQKKF